MVDITEQQTTKQPPVDGLVEVTLNVDNHQHAGQALKKGDKITVTQSDRDWLAERKLIKG